MFSSYHLAQLKLGLALVLLLGLVSSRAFAESAIHFKDRTIDLGLYLQGYPYTNPYVDLRSGKLFYKKRGKIDQLMMQSFNAAAKEKVDLAKGSVISQRDFSKRTWWGAVYSPLTQSVIIEADEKNDEIMNLYSLDPATGAEHPLTHTSYIYGWQLSHDAGRIAYVTRATKDELSPSDLRVLDLVTGAEKVVYKDSPERKIVWTDISWQPGDRGLVLSFNGSGDRTRRNLIYVPLELGGAPRVLTDESKKRYELDPLDEWLSDKEVLYSSDESGVTGIYRVSLDGGAPTLLTGGGVNIKSAALLADGERRQLVAISGDPQKSVLMLVDARTGVLRKQQTFDGQWAVEDARGSRAALVATSLSVPFKSVGLRIAGDAFELVDRVTYPDELLRRIVNCDVEKVSFVTFDRLSAPGEKGTLHAYLLAPKHPRPASELRALVLSFYGGSNSFWTAAEMLCEAGYYVMSPAPRGTADYGTAFYDLAAGDWGGAETLDGFAAGKYLQRRLGIPAARIGIFGHSRGGYDALRALTFPGTVNGVQEDFRFGFGIAESGIGDIIRAAKGGNISQWYANLTGGDPSKNAAKWNDRSPETHADLVSGPVLIVHGSNDQRVPVTESRSMYQRLKSLGKEAYFLELAGQGHGYTGIDALTQYYDAVFAFLGKLK
jgi:dipeptidyl aminopeptidase/acylaminoacyl peptidase